MKSSGSVGSGICQPAWRKEGARAAPCLVRSSGSSGWLTLYGNGASNAEANLRMRPVKCRQWVESRHSSGLSEVTL
jgi:hypothetical protein